jgi:hypothetical protein
LELGIDGTAQAGMGVDATAAVTAGSGSPQTGQVDGSQQGAQGAASQSPPVAQPGRTFTQADIDRAVQDRLQRAQQKWERDAQARREAETAQSAQDFGDPYESRFKGVETQLRELREFKETAALDSEWKQLCAEHPDAAKFERLVFATAMAHDITDLREAYRIFSSQVLGDVNSLVDTKAVGQKAVDEYLKSKREQAAATPSPEGKGGAAPAGAPEPKPKDSRERWKLAEKKAISLIDAQQR